jgi:hypothetical protein
MGAELRGETDHMNSRVRAGVVLTLVLLVAGCGFASWGGNISDPPGFFLGIWHGLLAPWTLILRLFMDIKMYAMPNSGWLYDLGFLIGIVFSLPLGWIAAIIAVVVHIL